MFGKSKNYIISAKNIEPDHASQIGHEAMSVSILLAAGITVPPTFTITTTAFDDFITAGNLIDKIAASISKVQAGNIATAQKASDEITDVILTASFPSIVLSPLIQAYKSMSGFSEKYVAVKPSWILPGELVPHNKEKFVKLNVKGEAGLLYAVKQAWTALFSPEALLLRADSSYASELSIAVEVQKMVQAEVSGTATSVDPVTLDDQIIEVSALLGLKPVDEDYDLQPDVYRVDANDFRAIEKNIATQEYMVLRKGRARPDELPNMKVAISPDWRRKQKLSDQYIEHASKIVKHLSASYDKPIEIHWAIETGVFYVLSVAEIAHTKLLTDSLDAQVTELLGIQSGLSILASEQNTKQELQAAAGKLEKSQKSEKPNLSSLADEVVEIAASPDLRSSLLPPEDATEDPLVSPENSSEPAIVPKDIEVAEGAALAPAMDRESEPTVSAEQLMTKTYLEISSMDSSSLAGAKSYDGVYFDATNMIVRSRKLPEDIVKNQSEYNSLVETYAQEIANAARVIEPAPLFYSFSDVGALERELMGLPLSGSNLLDGSERFVVNPEAMLAEILAVRKARMVYDAKNIELVIPKLRTEEELIDIKKILGSQNIRRSSVLQVFAEIATPAFLYEVSNISHTDIDGIIINYAKLGRAIVGRTLLIERDHGAIIGAIKAMQTLNPKHKFTTMIKLEPNLTVLKDIFEAGIDFDGLIFTEKLSTDFRHNLHLLEDLHLTKVTLRKPVRGRKVKDL